MWSRLVFTFLFGQSLAGVIDLNSGNFDETIKSNKLVFVNFYADWCRFSQMLTPIFSDAADKIGQEFPEGVRLGRVDAENQQELAARFHISKYPTLKLFRNGEMMKREYRGQRSPEAFLEYIKGEMAEAVRIFTSDDHLGTMLVKKSAVGFFSSKEAPAFQNFEKVSSSMKDECPFFAAVGSALAGDQGERISLRVPGSSSGDEVRYDGDLSNYQQLHQWATENCVPLVREITFANAEALTEEGLPFLILFHDPSDQHSVQVFSEQIRKDLLSERGSVNFIHADGLQFSHPLHHLGKSKKDLPVLAIDSFRHMYLFPGDFFSDVGKPGKLKQFVSDLHSGKLHREFHYGPDPTQDPPSPDTGDVGQPSQDPGRPADIPVEQGPTSPEEIDFLDRLPEMHDPPRFRGPPESAFAKLAPGKNRYSMAAQHDEL